MRTPSHLRTEVRRGADAQALLDNPLFVEALTAYEEEITQAWKQSLLRDVEGREKLRLMLEAANKVKAYLQTTADTGKLATAQIQDSMSKPGILDRWRSAA
jgi:hypothetical protein